MPRWDTGELIDAPTFHWRNILAFIGPGLVMGAAAIGGGEWLVGPIVTAKYGGALLWLATISIVGQVIYNIEISRYTLYCGEPIFTGKFRTLPGPHVWILVYLALDFGSIFPYLAANAATPIGVILLKGDLPDPENVTSHWWMMKLIACAIFVVAVIALIFGGKVYNSIKILMTFKLVSVFAVLLILAVFFSHGSTWVEICSGFFKFGNVPVQRGEDTNGNGQLDPGEDWDSDGKLDVVERRLGDVAETIESGEWPDFNSDGTADAPVDTDGDGNFDTWGDLNEDGEPEAAITDEQGNLRWPDVVLDANGETDGKPDTFIDTNHDGYRDGDNIDNIFVSLFTKGTFPDIDYTLIAFIAALAAIAGNGGLSNTPVSNFTRDQGWGMGHHVGAIPSMVGGQGIELSHVGCVFDVNDATLPRWHRWYRHIVRDQVCVWMPACFIGLALPSMLSVEFLRRGTEADRWNAAAMTADGVASHVSNPTQGTLAHELGLTGLISGTTMGNLFWFLTLFCGFLVLGPSMVAQADGIVRRWIDAFWTASGRLRELDPSYIKYVYFRVLMGYALFGLVMLWMNRPATLIKYATILFNFGLGFSCWHTIVVNCVILPKPIRPGWFVRIAMLLSGVFFLLLGTVAALKELEIIKAS